MTEELEETYERPERATFSMGCSHCGKKFIGFSTTRQLCPGIDDMGELIDSVIQTIMVEFGNCCNIPLLCLRREEQGDGEDGY